MLLLVYAYEIFIDILKTTVFFFFKQKTAYEIRISDWSSDVCSSDLHVAKLRITEHDIKISARIIGNEGIAHREGGGQPGITHVEFGDDQTILHRHHRVEKGAPVAFLPRDGRANIGPAGDEMRLDAQRIDRSEEHTSEPQSLMRISYAVFCL